ncbi:MAG TPA: molybdate transporter family protein, partial [Methanomicrobiales archaeon]|nr:molybdate transporter family protein [Methanomicrobiales archaeon]
IWFIISGWYYRLPIPIEPMKAVGVVVIAERTLASVVAASGFLLGVIFYLLGHFRVMAFLREKIPGSVIRGIQLGLALILLRTSAGFIIDDPSFFLISLGIILLFFFVSRRSGVPDVSALIVVFLGIAAGIYLHGLPPLEFNLFPRFTIPSLDSILFGFWELVVPQIPLTIANAILATALLASDLFHREVKPDRLSRTIGLMNIVSTPLGGFPMCHGAGGLAAEYRFGARTGGANIFAGVILILFALLFSSPGTVSLIPVGVFGALLIFVAIELGRYGIRTESYLVTIPMAVIALVEGITVAFIFGMVFAYVLEWWREREER